MRDPRTRHNMFAMVRLWIVVAAGAALAAAACRKPPITTYAEAPVIIVSIDTLRADRLGVYGYAAAKTPRIDALAGEGIVFEDAYSHAPLTLPAHASILTGLLPPRHGVRDNLGFTLASDQTTLAERFQAHGVHTGAAISAYVLRHQTGIAQGFDFYDDALVIEGSGEAVGSVQRDGAVAGEALARWIEGLGGKRAFAFLHLYEPHSPYAPPESHRAAASPYDGEVAYADEIVGRLFDRLKAAGLYDKALLVVTGDHGEGLKDHGESEHGIFLYREAVHVPLIVRLPGGARGGQRVSGVVSHVDLVPTILDIVGMPAASGLDGVSLRDAIHSGRATGRPSYAETLYPKHQFGWSDLNAVTDDQIRYIRAPRPEVYDRGADRAERTNLAAQRSQALPALNSWLDGIAKPGASSTPEEVPADVREKLAALGYVGLSHTAPRGDALPDPKDKIASFEEYQSALRLRQAGREDEAIDKMKRVLADNPRMVEAWHVLGVTLAARGRNEEGIAALRKVIEVDPRRPETHIALAKLYALGGRIDKAMPHAEIASSKDPASGFQLLAQLLMDAGRPDQAAAFAKRSVAADEDQIMAHFILGDVARRAGRFEEALGHYRRADTAKAKRKTAIVRNLYHNMGDCLARLGREAEAEAAFRQEIRQLPTSREAHLALALLYRSQGRDAEVRSVLEGLVASESPRRPDSYAAAIRTLGVLGDAEGARAFTAQARQMFPSDRRFR